MERYKDSEKGTVRPSMQDAQKASKGCCCSCWRRMSWKIKIPLIFVLVIFAGVVAVGGVALHLRLNVWGGNKNADIKTDFKCTGDCKEGVDHSLWDEVLQGVIIEGQERDGIGFNAVDYQKIRDDADLRKKLDDYIELLATTESSDLSQDEVLAFMLNAYNAFTVDLIVNKNPKGSIRDLTDLFKGSVFDRFKYKLLIENRTTDVSLNNVEHQIIRDKLTGNDSPQVHAAVNCASLSCPDLRIEAYTGEKLKEQLEEQTFIWLQNEGKGLRINREKNEIAISALFDWFREDFVSKEHGGKNDLISTKEPLDWAIQFTTKEVREFVEENDPKVVHMSYNWNLIRPNKEEGTV